MFDKRKIALSIVFLIALALRISFVCFTDTPEPTFDAAGYDRAARNFLIHRVYSYHYPAPTAYTVPGYPVFLSIIYAACGPSNYTAVRLIQAILSTFLVLFVFLIARKVFDEPSAFTAAIIAAFYPPFIWVNTTLLTGPLLVLFTVFFLWMLLIAMEKNRFVPYALSGLLLGITFLIKPKLALFPFFILSLGIWKNRKQIRKFTLNFFILIAAAISVLSPWIIRNYLMFERFIPFGTQGSNPLFQGSCINYELPFNPFSVGKDEFERNKILRQKALENIKHNLKEKPFHYISWYLSKFNHLYQTPYYEDLLNAPILWLHVHFIHIAIFWFFLYGVLLSFLLRKSNSLLLISFIIYYSIMQMAFVSSARHGLSLMPFAIIFASFSIQTLLRYIKDIFRSGRLSLRIGSIILASAILFLIKFRFLVRQPYWLAVGLPPLPAYILSHLLYLVILIILAASLFFMLHQARVPIKNMVLYMFTAFIIFLNVTSFSNFSAARVLNREIAFNVPLQSVKDEAIHIIDLPSWCKNYEKYQLVLILFGSSKSPSSYGVNVYINDKQLAIIPKGTEIAFKEYVFDLPAELVKKAQQMEAKIKIDGNPGPQNYLNIRGAYAVYEGKSLLNGQYVDLSRMPGKQVGTLYIGIRMSGRGRFYYVDFWRGSRRKI